MLCDLLQRIRPERGLERRGVLFHGKQQRSIGGRSAGGGGERAANSVEDVRHDPAVGDGADNRRWTRRTPQRRQEEDELLAAEQLLVVDDPDAAGGEVADNDFNRLAL